MQFWGVDVKSGGSVKVQPGDEKVVHLSQACLGEVRKDRANEFVRVFAKKDEQTFVIGILSFEKFPHINLDLVFEDEFELSHDWKHGSVHFAGYKADNPNPVLDEDESDYDLEETVPVNALINGAPEARESKTPADKANASVKSKNEEGKSKVKIVEPVKDVKENEEDDETEDADEESDEDEDIPSAEVDSEDDSDEEESDEEIPKTPVPTKKRSGESTSKTQVLGKKAKLATPQQKADGKKMSGHIATPHPAKQAAKTSASAGNPNQQTMKSDGLFPCSSCSRSFGSEQALQSHSKAKHTAK